jgi:Family of unknown function (DUF6158)
MELGIHPAALLDDDLLRELGHLCETRLETLRHGSEQALSTHSGRMRALESEYLRRFPSREVDPERLRAGARQRHRARAAGASSPGATESSPGSYPRITEGRPA